MVNGEEMTWLDGKKRYRKDKWGGEDMGGWTEERLQTGSLGIGGQGWMDRRKDTERINGEGRAWVDGGKREKSRWG